MKRKMYVLIIIVTLAVIATIFALVVFYNRQEHVILSKKFYIPIEKSTEIIYLDNQGGENPYCRAVLRISDSEYEKIILDMQKAEYYVSSRDEGIDPLQYLSDWLPTERIAEVYVLKTVEYYFVSGRRVQIDACITESVDGYREIYLYRS